jgi:hypothetical protein
MNRVTLAFGICLLLAASVIVSAFASPRQGKGKASNASDCFAKLKTLAGDWVTKDESGKEVVALRYKVTAAGNAVQETIFPGAGHEMVTVYTMDAGNLVLTHYCVLGNQPHLKATDASTPSKMEFTCIGGGNMKSENDMHMHHAEFTFKDTDHFSSHWSAYQDGKATGPEAKFEVTRKAAAK